LLLQESLYERKKEKTATIKLKNGTALDPDSGLEDVAHVYRDKTSNQLYTTVLAYTDIQKNKNSYYKMQVLESDNGSRCWLFRSWGRIGTTIGNKKVEMLSSLTEACCQFAEIFEEKTGNFWGDENPKKHAGKYSPIEIDYEDDEKAKKMSEKMQSIPSKLPKSVQDLVRMIFDIDIMKKALLEFELDLEKMPLGRLSKKQLQEAYKTLNLLSDLVTKGAAENEFIGLSNKFFTHVPHNFGIKKAPIINSVEAIQAKREMVDSLLEIEIAYSLLNDDKNDSDEVNPIDSHYEKLKTDMRPLDKDSKEFLLIKKYIENTHAKTHDQYTLEIEDVFAVERENEKRRYKPFRKLHNRQLLWHGSRLTNFVGILSHGLKIAPPEAPSTGNIFIKKFIANYITIFLNFRLHVWKGHLLCRYG
jgi:poly [ADP-ribose] polymerase 1